MEHHTTESREPRGVEEAGCKISSGAQMASQTTGWIRYDNKKMKTTTMLMITAIMITLTRSTIKLFTTPINICITKTKLKMMMVMVKTMMMIMITAGVALTRKNCIFYAKKEQATQI